MDLDKFIFDIINYEEVRKLLLVIKSYSGIYFIFYS